jgi:3-methyladenine DNA glycosylase AlkD
MQTLRPSKAWPGLASDHEARILASMIAEPLLSAVELIGECANDVDAWDVCDQVCGNLFDKTLYI